MAKKQTEDTTEDTKVNQPANAPIAPEANTFISAETLAHQWQKDSPALNTNTMAGYNTTENLVAKFEAQDNAEDAPEKEKETLTEAEYERRTKLDVSDPKYINPSLDHVTKGK